VKFPLLIVSLLPVNSAICAEFLKNKVFSVIYMQNICDIVDAVNFIVAENFPTDATLSFAAVSYGFAAVKSRD